MSTHPAETEKSKRQRENTSETSDSSFVSFSNTPESKRILTATMPGGNSNNNDNARGSRKRTYVPIKEAEDKVRGVTATMPGGNSNNGEDVPMEKRLLTNGTLYFRGTRSELRNKVSKVLSPYVKVAACFTDDGLRRLAASPRSFVDGTFRTASP